jgi:hypothetical protein
VTLPRERAPRGRGTVGSLSLLITGLAVLPISGCQVLGGPGPFRSAGEGGSPVYQGVLSLEGSELPAALEISRTGRRTVEAALQATSGLLADGEGQVRGSKLTLDLAYGGECPGWMKLEGPWNENAGTFEGVVTAQDCTGGSEGTFEFSLH